MYAKFKENFDKFYLNGGGDDFGVPPIPLKHSFPESINFFCQKKNGDNFFHTALQYVKNICSRLS